MRRMPCICNATFATGLLLLLATIGLTGCGFQPRGQAVLLSGGDQMRAPFDVTQAGAVEVADVHMRAGRRRVGDQPQVGLL